MEVAVALAAADEAGACHNQLAGYSAVPTQLVWVSSPDSAGLDQLVWISSPDSAGLDQLVWIS